jgi:chitodextrinase
MKIKINIIKLIAGSLIAAALAGSLFSQTGGVADTQAPTAPTNLTPSNITDKSVKLTWTASTDNVGVASYVIYRDGGYLKAVVGATFYDVTGLVLGTTYSFTVKAKDAAGNSSATSNAAKVTAVAVGSGVDVVAPTAPSSLVASGVTDKSVKLTWVASSDNVGVASYVVYRNGAYIKTVVGATLFDATGLTLGSSYVFTVKAKDAAGNISAASNGVTVTTKDVTAPSAPSGLTASDITDKGVKLTWLAATDNVGVTSYAIYRNGAYLKSVVGATFYSVTGLSASTSYSFTVKAKDAVGNISASSNSASVTTVSLLDVAPPTAPANLQVSGLITWNSVNLSWTASTDNVGVANYEVHISSEYGASVKMVSGTAVELTRVDLPFSSIYTFVVKAKDAAGNTSASSNSVLVDKQSPAAPTDFTFQGFNSYAPEVFLWWLPSADCDVAFYKIYERNSGQEFVVDSTGESEYFFNYLYSSAETDLWFSLRAFDYAGNFSDELQLFVTIEPQVEVPPEMGIGWSHGWKSVYFRWNDLGAAYYEVDFDGVIYNVYDTSVSFYDLPSTATYLFRVRAVYASGFYEPWTEYVSAKPPGQEVVVQTPVVAGAPSNFVYTAGCNDISLRWSYGGGQEFDVDSSAGFFIVYGNNVYIDGLSPNTTYTFRVRAMDSDGYYGAWSAYFSVTTLAE